jgi:hypothetical protein
MLSRTSPDAVLRWSARVFGGVVWLLLTVFAVAQGGPPNPWGQSWQVNVETHLLLVIWAGLLLGWKWEAVGGGLAIAGVVGFCVVEGGLPNPVFLIFVAAGLLYLGAWLMGKPEPRGR